LTNSLVAIIFLGAPNRRGQNANTVTKSQLSSDTKILLSDRTNESLCIETQNRKGLLRLTRNLVRLEHTKRSFNTRFLVVNNTNRLSKTHGLFLFDSLLSSVDINRVRRIAESRVFAEIVDFDWSPTQDFVVMRHNPYARL